MVGPAATLRGVAVILIGFVAIACSSDGGAGVGGRGGTSGRGGGSGASGGDGGAAGNGASAGRGGDAGNGGNVGGAGGGAGGTGGTGGGSGGPRTCTRFPAGCSCQDGEPASDEPLCSAASVATMPGDVGVCCAGPACECAPYICRNDAAQGYCSCGVSTTITGIVQGGVVTTCPLPTGPQRCCLSREFRSCICSDLECTTKWQPVPSCSISDVAVCTDSRPSVAVCSTVTVGAGGMDGGSGDAGAGGSGGGAGGQASGDRHFSTPAVGVRATGQGVRGRLNGPGKASRFVAAAIRKLACTSRNGS